MYLWPFFSLYFWELVVIQVILRVHVNNLSFGGCSHHFYYFNQMIDTALTDEQRNSVNHFKYDATNRPDIDHCWVMSSTKYQFRSTIASWTYIRQVGLISQNLSWPKITDNGLFSLDQNVMRLDIPMANTQRMNIV